MYYVIKKIYCSYALICRNLLLIIYSHLPSQKLYPGLLRLLEQTLKHTAPFFTFY